MTKKMTYGESVGKIVTETKQPSSEQKIVPIVPSFTRKYRLLCDKIRRKYKKHYISYDDDNKPNVSVSSSMRLLVNELRTPVDNSHCHNTKYSLEDIIDGIIEIIRNCSYWARYNGTVPGKYLNSHHNQFSKLGVYDCLYYILLREYFAKDKFGKLKYQAIDTTFSMNLYGSEIKGRNVKYKSKHGIKISCRNDTQGVPISLAIASGNLNDVKIAKECHINKLLIDPESKSVKGHKYQQKVIADAGYDDIEFRNSIEKSGCIAITDINPRNTKDPNKLQAKKIQKIRYLREAKNRFVVESFNSWIHKYPKVSRVIEKSIVSFKGLLLLACSIVVSNKIT